MKPDTTPPEIATGGRLATEHRRLREFTCELETTGELGQLLTCIAEIRPALVAHFRGEEAADGFYDSVRSMVPPQMGQVDDLEKEHAALLADLDDVSARAHACLAGPVNEILRSARSFAERLRAHEAAEEELQSGIVYTEHGRGD